MDHQGEQGVPGPVGPPGAVAVVSTPIPDPVIAYRLGQVEIAVTNGFKEHDKKLTELVNNFASTPELDAVKVRVGILETAKSKDWVWKTLSAAAGAVISLLIVYALTKN